MCAARKLLVKTWGLITKLWACYKTALPAIVAGLLLLLALDWAGVIPLSSTEHKGLAKVEAPAEFMYLDEARVNSYLSQVTGDQEEGSENIAETTTQNGDLGVELSYAKASLSKGSQLVRNIVVTRTAADRLQTLEQDTALHKNGLNAAGCNTFSKELEGIKDGALVKLENALVEMPPYLSAYPELRNVRFRLPAGSSVFGEVPLASFYQVDESVRGTPMKERETFKKAVGPNPRVLFSVSSATQSQKCERATTKPTTVVLPARFANLTGDPSLLGAPLTIIGIVVSTYENGFGDGTSLETYWPALSVAHGPFLRELGVKASVLKEKRVQVRKELFNAVKRTLTFSGRVVEVVPIAMYGYQGNRSS